MLKHKRNFAIILILSMITLRCEAVKQKTKNPLTGRFRIIGGTEARPGQFPAAVSLRSLQENGGHFCGGSIIGNRWVITVGECIEFINYDDFAKKNGVYPIAVIAGEIYLVSLKEARDAGHLRMVTDVFPHPNWDPAQVSPGIALIRVNKAFLFNKKTLKPLVMNSRDELKPGDKLAVAGWGLIQHGENFNYTAMSHNLLYIDLFYMKKDECLRRTTHPSYFEPEYIFCAADLRTKKDICLGDGGSGLVHNGVLYGSAYSSFSCGMEKNSVSAFHDVRYHIGWINEVLIRFPEITDVRSSSGLNSQKLSESIMFLLFILCISIRLI